MIIFGAALLAAQASAQAPAPFCGIDGTSVAALRAKAAADPRYKRNGGKSGQEVWSAESIQAILTFHGKGSAFAPAAVCQQVIDRDGTAQIERHVRCEAGPAACGALDADLDAAEAGSGDAE